MNKKIIFSLIVFAFLLFFINLSYATDIVMDLNSNTSQSSEGNTVTNNSSTNILDNNVVENAVSDNTVSSSTDPSNVDDTIYSSNQSTTDELQSPITSAVTTEELSDSGELSISNIINIILIVVGVVLILLGIAIIIRLK